MTPHYLEELNSHQLSAVTTHKAALILAGAGSGKTKVLTARILYLLTREQIPPEQILALTFTNKAAREMNQRLKAISNIPLKQLPTVSTFHALCVSILREYIPLLGYRKNFVIYDSEDQKSLFKSIIEEIDFSGFEYLNGKDIWYSITQAKSIGKKPQDFLTSKSNIREQVIGFIFNKYQELLKGCNAVDFDDLLILTFQLLDEHEAKIPELLEKYTYILIDEYQDTNRLQYKIVRRLIAHSGLLFAVGDDDQSIYSWRGADMRNIHEFKNDFPNHDLIRLEQNYRSTTTILNAANHVISNNSQRMEKILWTDQKKDYALSFFTGNNEEEELITAINQLKTWKDQTGCSWSDMAFLIRSKYQARSIEQYLRNEGVPYAMVDGTRFFDRKEVKDGMAYLKFLSNTRDEVNLHRIINYPRRGIGKKTLMHLEERRLPNQSLFDAMQQPENIHSLSPGIQKSIESLIKLIKSHQKRLKHENFLDVVLSLFNLIDIPGAISKEEKNLEKCDKKQSLYYEFLNMVRIYSKRHPENSLENFLTYVGLFEYEKNDVRGKIYLMTVHAAKGLEFDCVCLTGLDDEIFPNARSVQESGIEEERRLFYVAMTRAKKLLHLSYSEQKTLYGKPQTCLPSRFLEEIPENLLKISAFRKTDPTNEERLRKEKREDFFKRFGIN